MQQPTVIIQHSNVAVGPNSTRLTCPSCHAVISTRVERKSSAKTYIVAVLLCVFLCWPCVCVPFCTNSCRNANHYCPNCKAFLGTYN
ncbi:hypothetical protein PVAND_005327 [Polypedilum vanderplanki]|uniref:LITAF domain-containing protein n=1 Tax=Polypedilum vanderplanki TaxID=319348 RepID=A0A9J6C0P5_POLVA|nr:hypothetical protein PVAND_005327 [Polypedilum vanderplanki]